MLTIEQSREILGEKYTNCTDQEIQKVLDSAYMFADIFIEGVLDTREVTADSQ